MGVLKMPNLNDFSFKTFTQTLAAERRNRIHVRRGYLERIDFFCIAYVDPAYRKTLFGHLCVPGGKDAAFSATLGLKGSILLKIDTSISAATFSEETATEMILSSLEEMKLNAPRKPGNFSTQYWKGFYIKSTGKNSVGKVGKSNFEEAISDNIVSPLFRDKCIERGFTMMHCK